MVGSARSRWAIVTAVAALVTGGLFVAAPAQAATASIGVTVPIVYADGWSGGLDVIGDGFTPSSTATVSLDWVRDSDGSKVHLADTTTPVSATGIVSLIGWVPAQAPGIWVDYTLTLSATSDAGDTSNAVPLDVRNPPGIETNAPSLTTAQFMDPSIGLIVQASGFTPGEIVAFSAVYNGANLPAPSSIISDKYGSVSWQYVRTGSTAAGSVVISAVGANSRWNTTVPITGPTIGASAPGGSGGSGAPAASDPSGPVQATPRALPVVSG